MGNLPTSIHFLPQIHNTLPGWYHPVNMSIPPRRKDELDEIPDFRRLPKVDAPIARFDVIVERFEQVLGICDELRRENTELRAQLAAAMVRLLAKEIRPGTPPESVEYITCTGCSDVYIADLISPHTGKCHKCRSQKRKRSLTVPSVPSSSLTKPG